MTIGTLISKGEIEISDTYKYISDMKENNTTNNYKIRALITIEVEQWPFCYTVFITQFFQKTPPIIPNPWSPAAAVKTLLLAHGPNYLSVCLWLPLRAAVSRAQVLCGPELLTDTPSYPHLPLSVSSHTAAFTLALLVVIAYCH